MSKSTKQSKTERKPNPGAFKKGHDARRHVFTHDECSEGFWRAIESVACRYPDAIDRSGRHMTCNCLPAMQRRRMLQGK